MHAGSEPARTRRTLESLLSTGPAELTVTVVSTGGESASEARSGGRVRFAPRGELPGGAAGTEPLLLVEDGARFPADWWTALELHWNAAPDAASFAASTNHGSGPARLAAPPSGGIHRLSEAEWQALATFAAGRWPGVCEDVDAASSPLLALRPGPRREARVRAWLRDPARALAVAADERLVVARGLVVWREMRREEGHFRFLAAEAGGAVPCGRRSPVPDLVQRARTLDAGDRGLPRLQLALARGLTRAGDCTGAAARARTALAVLPRHVGAELILAEARLRSGELARARTHLAELQQEFPLGPVHKADLLACLGEIWRQSGDGEQAEQCLDAALAVDPLHPLALDARGLLWLEAGRFEDALASFRAAVRSDPHYAWAWSDYGRALVMNGDVEAARGALARALALHPGAREARKLLCRIAPQAARP